MTLREFHVFPWAIAVGVLLLVPVLASQSSAAPDGGLRLIMVRAAECRFCQRWEAEIGKIYDRSVEGRRAPLTRVERGAAELEGLKPAVYTPTFILARDGEEISRITGYPGEIYFWEELAEMLRMAEIANDGPPAAPAGALPGGSR